MMFFRASLVFVLPLLASANPFVARQSSACGGAPVSCCESMHSSNSAAAKTLLKENSLEEYQNARGMVAAGCNTGIGILDSPACAGVPVCCDAMPGSIIGIGCVPITL